MTDRSTDTPEISGLSNLPGPRIRGRRRVDPSLVWLVPLIAVLAGLVLIVRAYRSAGPEITVTFKTAEGLEQNKTEVRFKNVVIGKVREISLADEGIVATITLRSDAENLAVADTRFWVVRPRADLSGVSGLNTLFSGAYIGVDAGSSTEEQYEFAGLETPPAITTDQPGKRFLLSSEDLGSLSIGSPVYFRRIPVGRVASVDLSADGKAVNVGVFVDAPYDRYVTAGTHFWNASGVQVQLDAGGLRLNTQSVASLLTGGVAFKQVLTADTPAPADAKFTLFADETAAVAPADGVAIAVRMRFPQSIRGLAAGAPVDFKGIELGKVTTIGLDYDGGKKTFHANVTADLYPERLGANYQKNIALPGDAEPLESMLASMIERGLRAQLQSANLLTGALYVALDFAPGSGAVKVAAGSSPLEIPTRAGSLDQIQTQIASIVNKLDQVPINDIGNNLRATLKSADSLLLKLDTELAPEARKTLAEAQRAMGAISNTLASPDAPIGPSLHSTLEELQRAARSLRNLSDYLQRHPESLIRGKREAKELEENP